MNITYVVTNWTVDEQAIQHGLNKLGHSTLVVMDRSLHKYVQKQDRHPVDLVLFNHCEQFDLSKRINAPKVFWHFDLVLSEEEYFQQISRRRRVWMHQAMAISELGCCSDGELVDRYPDKLVRLTQEATDIRSGNCEPIFDWLFVGYATPPRRQMFKEIASRFPNYHAITEWKDRLYNQELADLFSASKIVIAPDSPIKDHYWSNRIYVSLAYGAFLLHPYIKQLDEEYYRDGEEVVYYRSREELWEKMAHYLDAPEERARIAKNGQAKTRDNFTLAHRCRDLMNLVQERGIVCESGPLDTQLSKV